jgi:hypothetical protein
VNDAPSSIYQPTIPKEEQPINTKTLSRSDIVRDTLVETASMSIEVIGFLR